MLRNPKITGRHPGRELNIPEALRHSGGNYTVFAPWLNSPPSLNWWGCFPVMYSQTPFFLLLFCLVLFLLAAVVFADCDHG